MSYIDIFRKNSYHCCITNEKTNEENYICSYGAGGNFDSAIFGWLQPQPTKFSCAKSIFFRTIVQHIKL